MTLDLRQIGSNILYVCDTSYLRNILFSIQSIEKNRIEISSSSDVLKYQHSTAINRPNVQTDEQRLGISARAAGLAVTF